MFDIYYVITGETFLLKIKDFEHIKIYTHEIMSLEDILSGFEILFNKVFYTKCIYTYIIIMLFYIYIYIKLLIKIQYTVYYNYKNSNIFNNFFTELQSIKETNQDSNKILWT